MITTCQNCEYAIEESFSFCPSCGQNTRLKRLTLREVGHEAFQHVTDIDKGLFTLLRDLIRRPGDVALEYIHGKRKKHFSPLSFYLIVGSVMIIVMHTIPATIPNTTSSPVQKEQMQKPIGQQEEAIKERQKKSAQFWQNYSDVVSIAAAPLLCLVYWLCFRTKGYNYAEHLTACLYMFGFTNLVYALIVTPGIEVLKILKVSSSLVVVSLFKLFEVVYFTVFYSRFMRLKLKRPLLTSALISVLAVILWGTLTASIMRMYITNGFWGLLD